MAKISLQEAWIEAYRATLEYREKVTSLLDNALGEWDGVYNANPSEREAEQLVFDRLLEPLQEHIKTMAFEAIDGEFYEALAQTKAKAEEPAA